MAISNVKTNIYKFYDNVLVFTNYVINLCFSTSAYDGGPLFGPSPDGAGISTEEPDTEGINRI